MLSDFDHSEQTETENESRDEHSNVDTANPPQQKSKHGQKTKIRDARLKIIFFQGPEKMSGLTKILSEN